MPALVLVGELDRTYVAVAQAMVERLPQPQVAIGPEAGHALHLEQPARLLELVTAFLGCQVG
jgi:pimeloyl-ACP methyl ester carboxylesterase